MGFSVNDFTKIKEAFLELNPHLIGKEVITFLLDEVQEIMAQVASISE
ncbi:MAG: hypothetical protein AB1567_00915 [bacterium]